MKLVGNTKNKVPKNKNSKNTPYLVISELILFHSNIANNGYQQDSRVLYAFNLNK